MAAMLKRISIAREQRVKNRSVGKSHAGNTTKIHLAVDGYGLPVEFEISGGEVNDCSATPELIARLPDTAIEARQGFGED